MRVFSSCWTRLLRRGMVALGGVAFVGVGVAAPLDLDPTWSGDGVAQFGFGGGVDHVEAVVVLPDGKMVLGGYAGFKGGLVRLLPSGARDSSFGTNGAVITTYGVIQSEHRDLHLLADGRLLAFSQVQTSPVAQVGVAKYLADGSPDASFGSGGVVLSALATTCSTNAGTVQADGKIVVTGRTGSNLLLLRWLANGSPDVSFGTNGVVTTTLPGGNGIGEDVAVLPDGKIVVAATIDAAADRIAVLRYSADGTLDPGFGTAGVTTTTVGNVIARGLAVQADGKVVVGGSLFTGSDYDSTVLRFTAAGAPDTAFGGGAGFVSTPLGTGNGFVEALTLQPDGRIVTLGRAIESGVSGLATCRYLSDGTLDASFSGDGQQINRITGASALGFAVALQSDGRMVLGGDVGNDFLALRLLADGTLDTTLNGLGGVLADVGDNQAEARAAVPLPDGGLLVVGLRLNGSGTQQPVVARLRADGTPHPAFNGGAPAIYPVGTGSSVATAAVVSADGAYLIGGTANLADFFLLRLLADGTPDPSFGTSGLQIIAVTTGADFLSAMLLQPDGKILLGGQVRGASTTDFGLVRLLAEGTLDTTFGTGGKVITDVGGNIDGLSALALQADGKILAAGSVRVGSLTQFGLCRYTSAGALDTTFSTDGKDWFSFGSGIAVPKSVLALPDGKILIGGDAFTTSATGIDLAVARYLASGTLDATFDGDGKATRDVAGETDRGYQLHLNTDGSYTLLGTGANQGLLAAARFLPTGAPDPGFDGDGLATRPTPGHTPTIQGGLRTADGHYVFFGQADNIMTVSRVQGDFLALPLPTVAITRPPAGPLRLTFPTTPGLTYHIQRSPTLAPASWSHLGTPSITAGQATFTDTAAPPVFYRVVVSRP